MVLTIFFSKKARSVSETELGLAKASIGNERFQASGVSRLLVRTALILQKIVPEPVKSHIGRRFSYKII